MTRELWLLRHGKSAQNNDIDDIERPLKKRGKRAALHLGAWLKKEQFMPDYIVSSPAKRAIATAKRVRQAIDVNLDIIQDRRLYSGGSARIKTLLADIPTEFKRVLIVGHNPDLEDLLTSLVDINELPEVDKLLPTTTLARIIMPSDWTQLSTDCASLLSITRAKPSVIQTIA